MDKQLGTGSPRDDGRVTRRTVLGGLVTIALTPALITGVVSAKAEGHGGNLSAGMVPIGLPMPRAFHTVTALHDRRLLVAGGIGPGNRALFSVLIYDIEREIWTEAGSMNMARYQHAALRLADGRVLVTGGLNRTASPMFGAEIYSPRSNSWSAAPSLIMARYGHTLSALEDGRVLVAGGVLAGPLSSMEIYSTGKED
jgi:hypothetical protein